MRAGEEKTRPSRQHKAKQVAFYVRASPDGLTVQQQLGELRAVAARSGWKVKHIYSDKGISGTKASDSRPEFDKLREAVALREIEMVVAWSVDRLGRSLKDLVSLLSDMQANGVDLFLFQRGLDTSTPSGRAMFQMLEVFSEFEAAMDRDRVRTGPGRAKKEKTRRVQPKVIQGKVKTKEDEALELLKNRMGILEVARKLKLGTGTVVRIAKSMRKPR